MTMLRFFVLFVVYMWCIMFVGAVQKGQTLLHAIFRIVYQFKESCYE